MSLSQAQEDLLRQLKTNHKTGLSTDDAAERREEDGCFNVVDPPINCPAWVCCLLPCIKSIPSMKTFRMIKPEDAEVLRDGHWIRYDATSLVRGDIIRLEEGDIVPADCTVLSVDDGQMLVDGRYVTGEDKPRSCEKNTATNTFKPVQLFLGSHVVQGSGEAVVTAIGPNTKLATVIREKRFPPQTNMTDEVGYSDEDPEQGISLVARDAC
ncbi:Sodium/potassium-transporting ATPase subunit alpha [Seminavis robusta]|uniref:Sodium/potassium-transporting ATPase subunit alpha n=1 Tax=Seminavis robusta TaxID=568900 RepID=A0A9N8EBE4_9STRA|nr:Sodium/potassium-transporting ATPase subunit alpha [Seminavis robusta]|eukprot:Sro762_g198630.1 Sodium/potassium-transporting ATPase subunit alpha (211) ;mRNA; f:5546-6324